MSGTSPVSAELLGRVRTSLGHLDIREVRMFGGVSVMIDKSMAVAVGGDGSLLVRVDPAEDAALLTRPHAARAEMGAGRSMGEGWIRVDAAGLLDDEVLDDWLGVASRYLARREGAKR